MRRGFSQGGPPPGGPRAWALGLWAGAADVGKVRRALRQPPTARVLGFMDSAARTDVALRGDVTRLLAARFPAGALRRPQALSTGNRRLQRVSDGHRAVPARFSGVGDRGREQFWSGAVRASGPLRNRAGRQGPTGADPRPPGWRRMPGVSSAFVLRGTSRRPRPFALHAGVPALASDAQHVGHGGDHAGLRDTGCPVAHDLVEVLRRPLPPASLASRLAQRREEPRLSRRGSLSPPRQNSGCSVGTVMPPAPRGGRGSKALPARPG